MLICVDHIWDQFNVFILLFIYVYKGFVTLNSYRGTMMVGGGGSGGIRYIQDAETELVSGARGQQLTVH